MIVPRLMLRLHEVFFARLPRSIYGGASSFSQLKIQLVYETSLHVFVYIRALEKLFR